MDLTPSFSLLGLADDCRVKPGLRTRLGRVIARQLDGLLGLERTSQAEPDSGFAVDLSRYAGYRVPLWPPAWVGDLARVVAHWLQRAADRHRLRFHPGFPFLGPREVVA